MNLQQVLVGSDRDRAHEELHYLLDGNQELTHEQADTMAAELARKDPSLLTEHLDSRYGPQVIVRYRDCNARPKSMATSGTWCMFAAKRRFPKVMKIALSAGVEADDPDVFLTGGLLSHREWSLHHDLLALALKYKANPDADIQPSMGSQVWPGTAGQVTFRNAVLNCRSNNATKYLVSVKMLLAAGAKVVGLTRRNDLPTVGYPSAAWELANSAFVTQDSLLAAAELVAFMKAAGLDIDTPCGNAWCPPVVAAARCKRWVLVEAFLAAGCRTDDEHIVRSAIDKFPAVKPLFDELDQAFGTGARSWAIEAMMKMQLASSEATVGAEPAQGGTARRRARAL